MTYQHIGHPPQPQPPAPKAKSKGTGFALLLGSLGLAVGVVIGCVGGFVIGNADSPKTNAANTTEQPTSTGAPVDAPGKTQKQEGPATSAVGTSVSITTSDRDQLVVTVSDPKAPVSSNNQFVKPDKGHFLTVMVTVEFKAGDSTYFASPSDFKLVGADGSVYQSEFLTTITPALDMLQLNAGQKVTGKVVFDVPTSIKPGVGAKVQFDGSWDGKAAAFWTI